MNWVKTRNKFFNLENLSIIHVDLHRGSIYVAGPGVAESMDIDSEEGIALLDIIESMDCSAWMDDSVDEDYGPEDLVITESDRAAIANNSGIPL